MKRSRIFMAAGTLTLVVAGIFASKANRFAAYTGPVYSAKSSFSEVLTGTTCINGNSINTIKGSLSTLFLASGKTAYGHVGASTWVTLYH